LDDIEVLGLAAETKFHLDIGMDQPAECLCHKLLLWLLPAVRKSRALSLHLDSGSRGDRPSHMVKLLDAERSFIIPITWVIHSCWSARLTSG
jgi:hypothetical protein